MVIEKRQTYIILFFYLIFESVVTFFLLFKYSGVIEPTGVYYALSGKNLVSGLGYTVFGRPQLWHPPLFPLLIGIFYKIIGNLELAGRLVSVVAFSISIVLIFKLAAFVYNKLVAYFAVIFFVTNKLILTYSNRVQPHSIDLLLILAIIYLASLIIKEEKLKYKRFVILGVMLSVAILNRAENIILSLAVISSLFILKKGWEFRKMIKFACLIITVAILLFPYANFLHTHTGKWTLTTKIMNLEFYRHLSIDEPLAKQKQFAMQLETRAMLKDEYRKFNIPKYITEHKVELFKRYRSGINKLIRGLNHILYYPWGFSWLLIALGLFGKKENRNEKKINILLISCLSTLIIIPLGEVLPRFLISCLPIFLLWMAKGLDNLYTFIKTKYCFFNQKINKTIGITAISIYLLLHLIPKFVNLPLYYGYKGNFPIEHKQMGIWMKNNIKDIESKKIASESPWVAFYSGASLYNLPIGDDFQKAVKHLKDESVDYVVINERLTPAYQPIFNFLLNDYNEYNDLVKICVIEKPKKIILYRLQR